MHMLHIFVELAFSFIIVTRVGGAGRNYFPMFYWDTGSSEWVYLFATSCDYCIQFLPATIRMFNSTLFTDTYVNNSISGIDELPCYENVTSSLSFASRKCEIDSECKALQHFMYSLDSTSNSSSIIHCTIGYSLSAHSYYYQHNYINSTSFKDATYELYLAATLYRSITIADKNGNDTTINGTFLNTQYYEKSTDLHHKLGNSYVYQYAPWVRGICYYADFLIEQAQEFDSIDSIDRNYNYNYSLLKDHSMIVSYTNNTMDYSTFYWYMEPPYCELEIDSNTSKSIPFEDDIWKITGNDIVKIGCSFHATVCLHKPLPYLINNNDIDLGIDYKNNNLNWDNYNNLLFSWYSSAEVDDFSEFKIYYSGFNKNNNSNVPDMMSMNVHSTYGLKYGFFEDKFYRERTNVAFDKPNYFFQRYVKMKTGYWYWYSFQYLYNIFLWNLSDMNTLLCFVISCQILNMFLIYGFGINVYAHWKQNGCNNATNANNDNSERNDANHTQSSFETFGSTMGQLYLLLFCLWFPWFIIAYFLTLRVYYTFTGDYSDLRAEEGEAPLFNQIIWVFRWRLRDYVSWTLFIIPSIIFILRLMSVDENSYDCIHCYTKLKIIQNSSSTTSDKQSFKLKCVKFCCDCQYCIKKPWIWKFYLFFCAIIGPTAFWIAYQDQWRSYRGPGIYVWTLGFVLFLIQTLPSLCMTSKYCIVACVYFFGIFLAERFEFWAQMGIIINFICLPLLFAGNEKFKHISFSILGMLIGLLDITTDLNLIYQWYFVDYYHIWATIQAIFIFIGQITASYFIGRDDGSIKSTLYLTRIRSKSSSDSNNNPGNDGNENGDDVNVNNNVTVTDRIFTLLGFGRVFLGVKAWTSDLY